MTSIEQNTAAELHVPRMLIEPKQLLGIALCKNGSQMEDSFDELYDFLFGDAGKTISKHNRYVPKVSQRMQSLNPMFGVIAMSMALLKEEELYRVGFGRMFVIAHVTALQLSTLITIDSMESLLDEADR